MAVLNFPAVYLLHGRGGSPEGSVSLLQAELEKCGANFKYSRPLLPHTNPNVQPSKSVQYLRNLGIPDGALIVGISLGGLVGAKLQESERPDLHVFCIDSPTWAGDTELHVWMKHRVALYSSNDEVIGRRTEDWPLLSPEALDLNWLSGHDTDSHKEGLAYIIHCYIQAGCLNWECR
jgi:hypothetical protein